MFHKKKNKYIYLKMSNFLNENHRDIIELKFENGYNNQQNIDLLKEIGVDENKKIKSILINLTLTTKQKALYILSLNLICLIFFAIVLSVLSFIMNDLIFYFVFFQGILIINLFNDLNENKINRNLLNYLLATQLNSAQNNYIFSASYFLKISGIKRSNHYDNNNKIINNDITEILLNKDNSKEKDSLTALSSENLSPIFERFVPFVNTQANLDNDKNIIEKVFFKTNDNLLLIREEILELNTYGYSYVNYKQIHYYSGLFITSIIVFIVIVIGVLLHILVFLKEGNRGSYTNFVFSIAYGFICIASYYIREFYCSKKLFFDFNDIYKERRSKSNYSSTGIFIHEIDDYLYLVKVSNYKVKDE